MKRTIAATVAVIALGAAVPLVAIAGGERHGDHGDGHRARGSHHGMHHGGGHGRGPGGKIRMLELVETYDADGDGTVTQDEIDQWRANRLAEFDSDNDGQLSLDEYEQLWLDALRERMVDQFQRHDDDGDGEVTVEEFGDRTEHMVLRMDRNDDGALSLEDLQRRRGGPRGDRQMPQAGDEPRQDGGQQGTDQQ